MGMRLDMLRAARSAPDLLHEAGDRVFEFLLGQFNADGGAKGRSEASDLYYTIFALDALAALANLGYEFPLDNTVQFLDHFGNGEELDIVHRACLARGWAAMPSGALSRKKADQILKDIASHRSNDGGFAASEGSAFGTVYHCFLCLGAYQDLGFELPDPKGLCRSLESLRTEDGAFANERGIEQGTTPTTAAAVVIFHELGLPVSPEVGDWLLARAAGQAGFLAMPVAPIPDLLSTATALHALSMIDAPTDSIREPCLDFIDSLWTGRTFHGHWADDVEDCEYTFYGLLALGHLGAKE